MAIELQLLTTKVGWPNDQPTCQLCPTNKDTPLTQLTPSSKFKSGEQFVIIKMRSNIKLRLRHSNENDSNEFQNRIKIKIQIQSNRIQSQVKVLVFRSKFGFLGGNADLRLFKSKFSVLRSNKLSKCWF